MQPGFPKFKKGTKTPPVVFVEDYLSQRAIDEARRGIFPDFSEPSSGGLPKLRPDAGPMRMTTCFLTARRENEKKAK